MIIFNQPYQVDYIKILGYYPDKQTCIKEQRRALDELDENKHRPISLGCMSIPSEHNKRGGHNEVGSSKEYNL